jgi:hypothetical protein
VTQGNSILWFVDPASHKGRQTSKIISRKKITYSLGLGNGGFQCFPQIKITLSNPQIVESPVRCPLALVLHKPQSKVFNSILLWRSALDGTPKEFHCHSPETSDMGPDTGMTNICVCNHSGFRPIECSLLPPVDTEQIAFQECTIKKWHEHTECVSLHRLNIGLT